MWGRHPVMAWPTRSSSTATSMQNPVGVQVIMSLMRTRLMSPGLLQNHITPGFTLWISSLASFLWPLAHFFSDLCWSSPFTIHFLLSRTNLCLTTSKVYHSTVGMFDGASCWFHLLYSGRAFNGVCVCVCVRERERGRGRGRERERRLSWPSMYTA